MRRLHRPAAWDAWQMHRRPIDSNRNWARRGRAQDRSAPLMAALLARFGALLVALAFIVSSGSLASATPAIAVKGSHIVATDGSGSGHPAPVEFLQAAPSEPTRLILPQPKGFSDDDGAVLDLILAGGFVFPLVDFGVADPVVGTTVAGCNRELKRARAPPTGA